MNSIQFSSPEFLHFLWSVPPLILVTLFGIRRKQKAHLQFHPTSAPAHTRRHKIQAGLLVASYLFLTIAIAQPRFGGKQIPVRQHLDIMLALDISTSMLAADAQPNRLILAKRSIFSLLERLQGNRIGLLLFAESSFVVCPLTTDTTTLKEFLTAVEPETLVHSGTDIGKAIETAIAHLNRKTDDNQIETSLQSYQRGNSTHKALILWTDGEEHGETGLNAAKTAAREGVHIYCIGVGTSGQSVPIPLPEGDSPENTLTAQENPSTYKRNLSGQLVLTELNEELLREIAKQGRGSYYPETEMNPLLRDLAQLQRRTTKVQRNGTYAERFQFFVAGALILLLCETFMSYEKDRYP